MSIQFSGWESSHQHPRKHALMDEVREGLLEFGNEVDDLFSDEEV